MKSTTGNEIRQLIIIKPHLLNERNKMKNKVDFYEEKRLTI